MHHNIASFVMVVVFGLVLCSHHHVVGAAALSVSEGASSDGASLPRGVIMPWFCLQRCDNTTVSEIRSHVDQIVEINRKLEAGTGSFKVEAVAFERYNLGANGTLVRNPQSELFDLNQYLIDLEDKGVSTGIKYRIAMVSSYPYPPQILSWTRALMSNPKPFMDSLRAEMLQYNIHGVNLDLEPTADATDADGVSYANFVRELKRQLGGFVSLKQPHGKLATVTAATWGKLWDIPLMARALRSEEVGGGRIMEGYLTSMNTYTSNSASFADQVAYNMRAFGYSNGTSTKTNATGALVTGLGVYPGNLPTDAEVAAHFDLLRANKLCRVAMWKAPFAANTLSAFEEFGTRCIPRP